VTEVITTVVKPDKEPEFRAWCEDIQAAQGGFAGYVGTYVQAPSRPSSSPGRPWCGSRRPSSSTPG